MSIFGGMGGTDFMKLKATLTLDKSGYEQELGNAESEAVGFKGKLAGGAKLLAKGFAVAGVAAAGAVTVATKAAIDGYADMEQLKGGIETLYGDFASTVIADANEAWKTAGMNANEYMETAIQSSAAMLNSLGGDQKKAAEMTNMAITDMSDNVNKMGTTMESVQDAYRGFSRGNFTMLDNLALGYAGTKEGMQQLLDKAMEIEKQQGRNTQFSIDSYADIVQAIHVVQDEMGITGTTAKEASETISGSISALKSAWQNLIVGFADSEADLDQLIDNVVQSAETVFNNLLPVAQKALEGIAEFIGKAAPIIAKKLPELITTLLPILLEAAINIVVAIAEALPDILVAIVDAIVNSAPMIANAGVKLLTALIKNLPKIIATIITAVPKITKSLVKAFGQSLPQLVKVGVDLIKGIGKGILKGASSVVQSAINAAKRIINAFKSALGIHSPSKIMAEYGKLMDEGLALGIVQNVDIAKNAMDSLADAVSEPIDVNGGYEETMVDVLDAPTTIPINGQNSASPRDLTVILELDRMQLGKVIYKLNNEETQRVGVNLAGGFA